VLGYVQLNFRITQRWHGRRMSQRRFERTQGVHALRRDEKCLSVSPVVTRLVLVVVLGRVLIVAVGSWSCGRSCLWSF
jgi:hypothetical protein